MSKQNPTPKSSKRQSKSTGPAKSWACFNPAYMKNNREMIQRLRAEVLEELEASRSDAAREIERITEALTRYWAEHGTCEDEKREFRMALRQINQLTKTLDDETAEHLHLVLLKDWYRSLFAREWSK